MRKQTNTQVLTGLYTDRLSTPSQSTSFNIVSRKSGVIT